MVDFLYANMIKMNCRPANLCGRSEGVPARKEESAVKIGSAFSYALIENGDIVFCEGAFDDFAQDGYVSKWLKRLKELDEEAAMGMSFATLSLYGAERSALEAALAPGDLLRDRNLPWLTLVPAQEEEGDFPVYRL
jgi:hypothetical protein